MVVVEHLDHASCASEAPLDTEAADQRVPNRVIALSVLRLLPDARTFGTAALGGRHWADAYLAAITTAGGYRLVGFDAGLERYRGLAWLHLQA